MTKRYVLGFCFNHGLTQVALIRKARSVVPEHVGLLNGVGGHVDPGEDPAVAVAREFREEAGYHDPMEWVEFARLSGEDHVVRVFRATADLPRWHRHDTEEGTVSRYPVTVLLIPENHAHLAPDLPWLVPMALQHLRGRGPRMYDIWQGSGERAPGAGDPGPGSTDPGAGAGRVGVVTGVGGVVLGTCELVGAAWPPAIDSVAAPAGVRNVSTTLPSVDCERHLRTGFGRAELGAREEETGLRDEVEQLKRLMRASVSRRVWDMSPLAWGQYLLGGHLSREGETFEDAGRPVWDLIHGKEEDES